MVYFCYYISLSGPFRYFLSFQGHVIVGILYYEMNLKMTKNCCDRDSLSQIGHVNGYAYKLQNGPIKRENIIGPFWSLLVYQVMWPISATAVLGHFMVHLVPSAEMTHLERTINGPFWYCWMHIQKFWNISVIAILAKFGLYFSNISHLNLPSDEYVWSCLILGFILQENFYID